MNKRRAHLCERRDYLVIQAANQRKQLADTIQPWLIPLLLADQGLAVLRYVNIHPTLIAGGFIIFAPARYGSVRKWLWRGWVTWQIAHKLYLRIQPPER